MDEETKVNLEYMTITHVVNGWIVNLSDNSDFPSRKRLFVFRNLDELFAWIRLHAE